MFMHVCDHKRILTSPHSTHPSASDPSKTYIIMQLYIRILDAKYKRTLAETGVLQWDNGTVG